MHMSESGPMCSTSPMMVSFSSCASLTAVLSAFQNLKGRYNKVRKENMMLKEKISKYEDMYGGRTIPKTSDLLEKCDSKSIDRIDLKVKPISLAKDMSAIKLDDVLPTVQSIVSSISDQLIIIGHQLDSLLLDFDRIETKDEVYKVEETVKMFILPRLTKIREKEIEYVYQNSQDMSSESKSNLMKKTNEELALNSKNDCDEAITENLLKLKRLLRTQNTMLKNIVCIIGAENSSLLFGGWSLVNET